MMVHASFDDNHTDAILVRLKILQCRSERQMHIMTFACPPNQEAVEAQIEIVIDTITAI